MVNGGFKYKSDRWVMEHYIPKIGKKNKGKTSERADMHVAGDGLMDLHARDCKAFFYFYRINRFISLPKKTVCLFSANILH